MTLAAGTPVGKYIVRRKLAEGGMAEIYLCSVLGPEGFEKEVVIKRVRPALGDDPEFVQMFISEARLASKLNHANIVQIFDFDKHENTYYLAMEYVRGKSLWELRKRCKERMLPIPPPLAAKIGMDVARGLHFAHGLREKGERVHLVHRDVTPHNILISYDGSVKLTDFGIAKAGNRLTASGMLKGKFAYMAPEQARAEPVDARTDVFALGIVLWELVTGGRLFDGDSDVAVLRAVQESSIPPPARINPDVDATLDAAIMKALARAPSQRFQSAQEMEQTLAHYFYASFKSLRESDLAAFLRSAFDDAASLESFASGAGDRDASMGTGPSAAPALPVSVAVELSELRAAPGSAATQKQAPDEDAFAATVARSPKGAVAPGASGGTSEVTRRSAPLPSGSGRSPRRIPAWLIGAGLLALLATSGAGLRKMQIFGSKRRALDMPTRVASTPETPLAERVTPELEVRVTPSPAFTPAAPETAPAPARAAVQVAEATGQNPKRAMPSPPARAFAEGRYGYVVLRAQPWAQVTIDNRRWKEELEGQRRLRLPAGLHRIQLSNNASSVDQRISVAPDHPVTVELAAGVAR